MVTECFEMKTCHPLFIVTVLCICNGWSSSMNVIQISESGNDPVPIFSTVLILRMTLMNTAEVNHHVIINPLFCCLNIDFNDTDCEIMSLQKSPVSIDLGRAGENDTEIVTFAYRNLYARYRVGNCSFTISTNGLPDQTHTLLFNSTPANTRVNSSKCTGLDQDPDRECTPADCAIKYKGKRNFYRKKTGKCEPVVPCHTRADDGITITGYYDWEDNICIQYKWFQDDNYFEHVESDTEIPKEIDPSLSNYKYFADLEPHLTQLQNNDSIDCNHGVLDGFQCRCDTGWLSSGIHSDDPVTFHWCDTPDRSPSTAALTSTLEYLPIPSFGQPYKLSKTQEIISIVTLGIVNLALLLSWIYLLVVLIRSTFCTNKGIKDKGKL